MSSHTNKRRGRVGASGLPNTSSRGTAGTAGKDRALFLQCPERGRSRNVQHGLCVSLPAQDQLLIQNDSHCLVTKSRHPFVLLRGRMVSLLSWSGHSAEFLEGKVGKFFQFLLPEAINPSQRTHCLVSYHILTSTPWFLIAFLLQHLGFFLHSNHHC